MSDLSHLPSGYHSVMPYLLTADVGKLLEFILEAFDAETTERVEMPDGTVSHAEVQIGDSRIMLGQARDEWPPMPSMLYLYVPDCDAAYAKAMAAGAEKVMEPMDQFYGDRSGGGGSTRSVTSGGSARGTRKSPARNWPSACARSGDSNCRDRLAKRLTKWLTGRLAAAVY